MSNNILYRTVFIVFVFLFGCSVLILYRTYFIPENNPDSYDIVEEPKPTYTFYPSLYKLNENNRMGLGVYIPDQEETNFKSVVGFENLIQRRMEYVMFFRAWGNADSEFPTDAIPYLKHYGYTPIITWEPWERNFAQPFTIQPEWSLESISNGDHDEYIKTWAIEARDAEIPIILRFGHEMIAEVGIRLWYPWQGDPSNYIKAYRRITDIFRLNRATNVSFMWSPIVYQGVPDLDLYYPGEAYVDYIGITIINLGDDSTPPNWKDCRALINEQYVPIQKYGRPVIISELLSAEGGGNKAEWYTSCFRTMEEMPDLIGVVSIQRLPDTFTKTDWRVDSSLPSLQAFINGVKNGNFK